ncbi:hypothetical protein [Actinoallomurus iriomotensis]|uniref:Uncharacterized protein n=1 Tax=Actinoallomurus iriomotensis TaxID=478107 RepID=A0A9W6VTH1_9ACTN|nr:hypothetical protein [Actinoallomurus iriomotensis]GLY79730.1 hypothetical protein Airi01_079970 [Actinoallomurus iriomotensis]
MAWDIGPELRALAVLCKELNAVGVGSEMRDAFPGLAVRTSTPGAYIYVLISPDGERYVWDSEPHHHPVSDAPGAAEQIKAYLRAEACL